MENWCPDCQSEGKEVVGRFSVGGKLYCFGHAAERRVKEKKDKAAPPVADGPRVAPGVELPPTEPTPRRKGRLEQIVDDDLKREKAKEAMGRPKGSKNKAKDLNQPAIPNLAVREAARNFHTAVRMKRSDKNSAFAELKAKLHAKRHAIDEAITAIERAESLLSEESL